ncbi:LOW QUALITY PROTEIN: hypothetical protein MXB_4635 [Myxobolus squamalis]|nr:LOW QUALITY PROTEIN: hypothetical protein MXB_4635 [Myxobolus squamalis]
MALEEKRKKVIKNFIAIKNKCDQKTFDHVHIRAASITPKFLKFKIKNPMKKAQDLEEEARLEADKSDSLFQETCSTNREFFREYFYSSLPKQFQVYYFDTTELEILNGKKTELVKTAFTNYLEDYGNKIIPIIKESLETMSDTCRLFSYEEFSQENQNIADELLTGYPPPIDCDYYIKKANTQAKKVKKIPPISRMSKRQSTINFNVDIDSAPPAKKLPLIESLYIQALKSKKSCMEETRASKKLLLTVPKYGGAVMSIESHYRQLEQDSIMIEKQMEIYLVSSNQI